MKDITFIYDKYRSKDLIKEESGPKISYLSALYITALVKEKKSSTCIARHNYFCMKLKLLKIPMLIPAIGFYFGNLQTAC